MTGPYAFGTPSERVMRWVLSWIALGWAAVLAQPGATFEISSAYAEFDKLMSEHMWAWAFLGMAAVTAGSFWTRGWLRIGLSFSFGVQHALMALAFGRASHLLSTGTTTHLGLVALAWWLVGRDLVNRRA